MMLTDFGVFLASIPDAIRLLIIPVFAWIAWTDIKTRRISNTVWVPLLGVGGLLFIWEVISTFGTPDWVFFAIPAAISVFVVIPVAFLMWLLGGFGGADAKAIMTLAVFFPTYPAYYSGAAVYPVVESNIGSFAFTIFANSIVLAVLIPVGIALLNTVKREWSKVMFIGLKKRVEDFPTVHGRLLETQDGYSRKGLDLDVLRMYLQWRDVTLSDLREDPHAYRHPATIPDESNSSTTSTATTDGGVPVYSEEPAEDLEPVEESGTDNSEDRLVEDADLVDDPELDQDGDPDWWGADAFLTTTDYAYGASTKEVREGLEVIVQKDTVWVSPGTPFMVPIFAGIVTALLYGNVLFGVLSQLGLV